MSRSRSSFKVKGQIKVNVIGGHLSLTVTALVLIKTMYSLSDLDHVPDLDDK